MAEKFLMVFFEQRGAFHKVYLRVLKVLNCKKKILAYKILKALIQFHFHFSWKNIKIYHSGKPLAQQNSKELQANKLRGREVELLFHSG